MAKFEFWKSKRKQEEPEQSSWSYERYPADTTRSSLFSAEDEWDVTQSKPVFTQAPINSTTRPRSYEEFLRARGGGGVSGQGRYHDSSYGGGGRRFYEEEEAPTGLPMHRLMQIIGAIALTGLLYFTFHSDSPTATRVQAYVSQKLTNDSNLSGMTAWWQSNVADKVAVPAMSTGTDTGKATVPATAEQTFSLVLPVQGAKVKNAYDGKEQQGITYTAPLGAEVHAAAKGTVEKIEKGAGDDYSVTINHGDKNGRTVYSHLASVDVAANAVVERNQKIGALAKKGASTLFFAYQNEGSYLDPNDLLTQPNTNPTSKTPAPANESSSTKASGGA